MFQPAHDAGFTPADLIRLVPISRVTASLWLNGHTKPHPLLAAQVRTLMAQIAAAVAAGDLPVSRDLRRPERAKQISVALAKQPRGT